VDKAAIIAKIQDAMIDVLDLDELTLTEATTAKDVEGWDSLSHLRLIVAVEQDFGLKFTTGEIERFKNIGDMVSTIQAKQQ
jgi:acyl carrier protein